MRDINKYTEDYAKQDFEVYQVEYRRKKIIEQIDKYHPKRILEIECGMEPLFLYVQGFLEEHITELKEENYDMIICAGLLQEVEDPEHMLQDIFQLCGNRTIVHINVANAKSFHRILARNMGISNEYELTERNILCKGCWSRRSSIGRSWMAYTI